MEPTLHKKDVLFVMHEKFSVFKKNNIILIKKEGKIMVKRIHKITKHGIDVRGDNAQYSHDTRAFGLVKKEEVVGQVINKICFHN